MKDVKLAKRAVVTGAELLLCAGLCLAGVGISVTSNTFNAGSGGSGNSTSWTPATLVGRGAFTVENISDTPGDLKISATNTTPNNWILSTNPGLDTFALQWGQTTLQGQEPSWRSITTVASPMLTLAGGVSSKFDLRFQSPANLSDRTLTTPQKSTVTIAIQPAFVASVYVLSYRNLDRGL